MCVGFAHFNLEDPIPVFKTLDNWEKQKSTKIDTCARMCRHLLARDDGPEMLFENGAVTFHPIPAPNPGNQPIRVNNWPGFPCMRCMSSF